ncbi:MAG TPA: DNA-directed RNA polymerase subunit omega [Armatimonadota bacterium]|nr:DNA-directed RNA polymerase subunit omega [Armatimonadota bacterium]
MASLDELLSKVPGRFNLVMVAAKRARQVKDGAPRLIPTHSVNPVTVALEEISAGKIVLDGMTAHILDDFGKPMPARQPDALEELLALPEGDDGFNDILDEDE